MLGDKTVGQNPGTANLDRLSGAPGAHPVGVGVGAGSTRIRYIPSPRYAQRTGF